jgi:galactose-1-phosphate uridylyltransferase
MDHPHRRFNRLSGDWVLVSPHRAQRGYEMLGEAQRDITPEIAAARLRNCSDHCSPGAKA